MQGGEFDPMGADPNIGAGIGNMADDPNAGMPGEDPAMNDVDPNIGSDAEGNDDSTTSIIDQLSDEDKEAVRNYAKSLLSRDEGVPDDAGSDIGGDIPEAQPQPGNGGVMMEISKGRLKNVQRKLSEKFRDNDKEEETNRKQQKVRKNTGKKSPFDSPLD